MDKNLLLTRSVVPCLFDANLESLPGNYLLSGIGFGDDLKFLQIDHDPDDPNHWYPSLNRGDYFIGTSRFFLPSRSAAFVIPRGISENYLSLPVYPEDGQPISVVAWSRDELGNITGSRIYRQCTRFTGTIVTDGVSAVEQVDSDFLTNYNLPNADTSKLEFVVVRNRQCRRTIQIPVDAQDTGYISLDPPALVDLPIIFSNHGVLTTQVSGSPSNPGEWQVSLTGDQINLGSGSDPAIIGTCTYYADSPATLIFAADIVIAYGEVIAPEEQLASCEVMGISTGMSWQHLSTQHFPLLSVLTTHVYVFDSGGVGTEWTIVESLSGYGPTDQVCTLEMGTGIVGFGDGVTGAIPEVDLDIGIVYSCLPAIWYETKPQDSLTAHNLDLNPFRNFTQQGFFYLSHRSPVLQKLTLECDKSMALQYNAYGPLYCGNDFTQLICTAFNANLDSLEGVKVEFYVDGAYGFFSIMGKNQACQVWTGPDGKAKTIFYAPRNILDMAEIVELYDNAGDPLSVFHTTTLTNDTLDIQPLPINDVLLASDSLTFMVLDDDPEMPYNPFARQGGALVLLYSFNAFTGRFEPTIPQASSGSQIIYGSSLPTPATYSQLRKFVIAIPRIVQLYCQAIDPQNGTVVQSNRINILIQAPVYQMGAYTVKNVGSITPGDSVGTATYLTIDRRGSLRSSFTIDTILQ